MAKFQQILGGRRSGGLAWLSILVALAAVLHPFAGRAASSWAGAKVVTAPGCNAVAFAQLPGSSDWFLGRQLLDANGNIPGRLTDCSGGAKNRWALTLDRLDWSNGRMATRKVVLDTSTDPATGKPRARITAGPFAGAYIQSAYDPSVVQYNGEILVSFECILANGGNFGVVGTSSCVGVFDPQTQTIDLSRTTVPVSGHQANGHFTAGAVGKLLVWDRGLYIYWSSLVIGGDGKFQTATMRGAQLTLAPGGIVLPASGGKFVYADSGPIVWGTVAGDALRDTLVDVRQLWSSHGVIYVLAGLGGSGCAEPLDGQPGCFRLAAARGTRPLAPGGFRELTNVPLPTNPQGYGLVVHDPSGQTYIIGSFAKPPVDGVSDRDPAPGRDFWAKSPTRTTVALFPLDLAAVEK